MLVTLKGLKGSVLFGTCLTHSLVERRTVRVRWAAQRQGTMTQSGLNRRPKMESPVSKQ